MSRILLLFLPGGVVGPLPRLYTSSRLTACSPSPLSARMGATFGAVLASRLRLARALAAGRSLYVAGQVAALGCLPG